MATENKEGGTPAEDKLTVTENSDGTVTVHDPDEKPASTSTAATESEDHEEAADPSVKRTEDEDDEDDPFKVQEQLSAARTDEERDTIRERRRQERKDKKQAQQQRDADMRRENQALKDSIRSLNERLGSVSNRQLGTEMANLDAAIANQDALAEQYVQEAAQASNRGDGLAHTKTLDMLYQTRARSQGLKDMRQRVISNSQAQPANGTGGVTRPDPELVKAASRWASANSWYNIQPPGSSPEDNDSRLVQALDASLGAEGYNPTTQAYWTELDKRIAKVLPHRAARGQRENPGIIPGSGKKPGRSTVTGAGQSAGSRSGGAYTLSPERVKALKEAGNWEDPKARNDMIRRYREFDASQKSDS